MCEYPVRFINSSLAFLFYTKLIASKAYFMPAVRYKVAIPVQAISIRAFQLNLYTKPDKQRAAGIEYALFTHQIQITLKINNHEIYKQKHPD
jgi:hypothetical protein